MVRRYLTLAAMLLVMASLMVGIVGTASAQVPETHEADGRWRHQASDGPVSFRISSKGMTQVRWKDWISSYRDVGEGKVEYVEPADWSVTVTSPGGTTRTKNTGTAGQRTVSFRNLAIGQDHVVVVKGLDSGGRQLGDAQSVTIRSRHVSAPQDVTGLTLTVGADGLSVAANWTAPAAGGTPKRYMVYLTNLDSGRTLWTSVDHRNGRGHWKLPKTEASFDGLWPGDRYRVSVQTRNRNSRSNRSEGYGEAWQRSAWVSATVAMPAGDNPSYERKVPTLIWIPVSAGEAAPPYALGEPTAYVVFDHDAPGGLAQFDFPNKCGEYLEHYQYILDTGNEGNQARLDAHKARRDAWLRVIRIERDETELAELKSKKGAATDPAEIARLGAAIKKAEVLLSKQKAKLVTMEATVATKCAAAYPVKEGLTEADDRFYRVAQTQEAE